MGIPARHDQALKEGGQAHQSLGQQVQYVLVPLPRAVDSRQRRSYQFAALAGRRAPGGGRVGMQDFGGGDLVGGKFAVQALVPKIFGFLLWNAAFLGAFSVFASFKAVTVVVLFLVGTGFALVLALQTSLMNVAREVRTLAATLTIAPLISQTRSVPSWGLLSARSSHLRVTVSDGPLIRPRLIAILPY